MASDNRSFLGIVLGAIMAALVVAAYFGYGQRSDSTVKIDHPAIQVPEKPTAAVPPPMAPAAPAPAEPAAPPTSP